MPDSKFNLVSVDSITKGTRYEVVFGKNDCLLTDPHNPKFRQILGYNHGGLYHLAGKCIVCDHNQTTDSTRESHFRLWLLLLLLLHCINKLDNSSLVLTLKMRHLSPKLIYAETTLSLTLTVYLNILVSRHLI